MKKKILVGYIMDGTSGGIDRYLLRFIEQVWEEDIQIDFLSDRSAYELKKRLEKYKSRVFQVSSLWHPVTQYRQMQKIIQENGYDVEYFNSNGFYWRKSCKRCRCEGSDPSQPFGWK